MFRKLDLDLCGIAIFPDVRGPTDPMPMPSPATRKTGYSTMNWQCVANLSFHHEIGHNMGIRHDRYVDNAPAKFYNHGYTNLPKKMRTIMAYNDQCANFYSAPNNYCVRINWFSSKTIKAGKVALGAANGSTDNTKRLKQTVKAVSKYY
jgi:hypothetical protein